MAKFKRYSEWHNELGFYCPGCKEMHYLRDEKTDIGNDPYLEIKKKHNLKHDVWEFNNNFENPTVHPSVLVVKDMQRCHSFIRNGKIQFLSDCTHELRNQTIEIPDLPNDVH